MSVEDKISAYRRRKDARQKGNAYYNFKKRRAARKAEREDAKWITIGAVEPDERRGAPGMKGRHVLIDDEGKVLSGAGGSLTGVTLSGAESTSEDVKVDPKKTSDPLPTSPAGEEGKSSSEVAAEAKETESKGAESEEPKKESGKADTETLKAVKDNSDELKEWLDAVPEGTEIVFADEDGDIPYKLKKTEGGAWTATYPMSGETETFSDAANMAADLPVSISAFEGVGGSYQVFAPGEEPKEPEEKSDKFSIHDFESAIHDKDKLKDWLENVPTGTRLYYDVDGTEVVIEKDKFGTWHERFVGSFEDEAEFDESDELMKELETIFDLTSNVEIVDAKSGEKITVSVGGDFDINDFDAVKYDDGLLAVWLDRAPAETKISFHDSVHDEDVVIEKHKDGTWTERVVGDLEGDETEYANGTELLDEMHGIMANEFAFDIVDGSTGEAYISEKAKEGGTAKGEIDIDAFKKAIADGDEEGYAKLLENAPVGTTLVHDKDEFIKKDDGKFYLKGYEEPGSEFDDLPIPFAGANWSIVDPTTGELITLSEATPKASEEKELDIDDLKEKIKYGQADKGLKSLPTGAVLKTGDSKFVKMDDGKFYFVGHEGLGGFDTTAMAYSLSGETVGGWEIKDPKTGEWVPLKDGPEAIVDVEEDVPYKPKDDLASAVMGFDEKTINKKLDELKVGATIIAKSSYKHTRYTKQGDGSWKKETKNPWSIGDDWMEESIKNNHDVAVDMAVANSVSVDGEEIDRPAMHAINSILFKLKTGDGDVESLKKQVGMANKDFGAVMKNIDGETVYVTKQADGTFKVKENDKTKKLSETGFENYIKNKDLWVKTRITEAGWAASGQYMLKKHLAPLKKSILTSPDYDTFHDTLKEIKIGSTFQIRNTDGSGYVVRKMSDGYARDKGYVVKEIDKDGNIKDVEFFLEKEDTELHKKLSEAAKKGATFSADLEIGPYVPPEKKPAKKTYKGPADTSSHASEGKTSGGLSTVKFGEDAYSDAARKGAIQEPGTEEGMTKVHKELFPAMKEWWKGLSSSSKSSLRDYTGSYHDTNEPLRGYSYTSYTKDADHIRNKIKAIDDALEQTTMDKPIVLTRGISLGTFRAMVDHQSSSYSKWGPASFDADLIGKEITEPSYMSCTAAGSADFSSKPVQLKIYCPTGTKGAYINPISSYGMKLSDSAVETSSPKSPASGSEFEFLLQRGCKFKVRNITKSGGKYKVELDLVEQNPRPMKVVGTKCVYDDGKDAYDF
ncbi:MAG: hypothetical protein IJS71_08385 [Clostridia bacterium]|nr:hypothetical protein [Clostridia bacterium]